MCGGRWSCTQNLATLGPEEWFLCSQSTASWERPPPQVCSRVSALPHTPEGNLSLPYRQIAPQCRNWVQQREGCGEWPHFGEGFPSGPLGPPAGMILSVSPDYAGNPQAWEHGWARGLGSWAEMSTHRPKNETGWRTWGWVHLGGSLPQELRAKGSATQMLCKSGTLPGTEGSDQGRNAGWLWAVLPS